MSKPSFFLLKKLILSLTTKAAPRYNTADIFALGSGDDLDSKVAVMPCILMLIFDTIVLGGMVVWVDTHYVVWRARTMAFLNKLTGGMNLSDADEGSADAARAISDDEKARKVNAVEVVLMDGTTDINGKPLNPNDPVNCNRGFAAAAFCHDFVSASFRFFNYL